MAEKGYRDVFDAIERLAARVDVTVVVVGPHDPDKADALSPDELERASAAGVRLLGVREDIERLYPAMDLYVLASHREGFPRSAMEASAMGLAVVATDIRGCRQAVEHERTGLLVPVRDSKALADAIAELVTDTRRRRAMGEAARAKALAEFDDRQQIAITAELYRRLLDGRRP